MINENTIYWLWLAEKCGIASKHFDKIIQRYKNPFDLYRLDESDTEKIEGISAALRARLCEKNLDEPYSIIKYCKQNKIDIISYGDTQYPECLRRIEDPPIVLYCRGSLPRFDASLCIGIVGTRKMSEYGKESAYKIAYELASAGVVSVSGMALGIDGVAECGALAAGGRTVAVLGCGIKTVYPKVHKRLCEEIARHGAVITEFPPDEEPHAHNFPKRNRIISALCKGVLVVEAAERSGALITAHYAIAQGKEVFALPGKISDEGAKGPNSLISKGAYTALSSNDILTHYEFLYGDDISMAGLGSAKKRMPSADTVLAKYGLDYAVGTDAGQESILYPKRKESTDNRSGKKKAHVEAKGTDRGEIQKIPEQTQVKASGEAEAFLATLDSTTQKIYGYFPQGKAISTDEIVGAGYGTVTDTLTALTLLEVGGLISSLPGGMYIKK